MCRHADACCRLSSELHQLTYSCIKCRIVDMHSKFTIEEPDQMLPFPDPPRKFIERIPDALMDDIFRLVLVAWKEAKEDVERGTYVDEIVHDLFPHVLRAKVDSQLGMLSGRHPRVQISMRPNNRNNSYHCLIESNGVLLTASAVRSPTEVARPADFRNNYAQLQGQFILDDEADEWKIPTSEYDAASPVYAIILHGPDVGDRFRNGFVHIVFLDQDGVYLENRIRLELRYPAVVSESAGIETIEDRVTATPKVLKSEASGIEPEGFGDETRNSRL